MPGQAAVRDWEADSGPGWGSDWEEAGEGLDWAEAGECPDWEEVGPGGGSHTEHGLVPDTQADPVHAFVYVCVCVCVHV